MEGRPPVVLFGNVTKTYGAGTPEAFTAIQDVSFSVADLHAPGVGGYRRDLPFVDPARTVYGQARRRSATVPLPGLLRDAAIHMGQQQGL